MDTTLVSIIIVNYNTEELIEDCICSIEKYVRDVNYEIIVVDNASDEGALQGLVSKFHYVRFHLIGENLGFGAANNIGASIANGEYLFFLNPDTILLNDAVSILYNYLNDHKDVGVCGGNMYKRDMTPASSYYDIDFFAYEYKIVFNRKRTAGFNYSNMPQNVKVIVGADFFISKSLFREFGGFDKDFFMYFEEVELCYRLIKANYKIVSVPFAEIIHLQGGSAENKNEELSKWSYREHWYSKFVFFSKTKGRTLTKTLFYTYCLKMKMAQFYYSVRNNQDKLEYWNKKKEIITETYNRYQRYLVE